MKYSLFVIVTMLALRPGFPQNIDILPDGTRVAYLSNTKLISGKERGLSGQWAACLQFALNSHGISIAQEEVLHEHPFLTGPNASLENILLHFDGWQVNSSTLSVKPDTLSPTSIKHALAFNRTVIVLAQDNYRPLVLTAFFYHQKAEQIRPESVVIRDPSLSLNKNRQVYSWAEFQLLCTSQIIVLYL